MSDREEVLRNLRHATFRHSGSIPLEPWIAPSSPDASPPLELFEEVLRASGGTLIRTERRELSAVLSRLAPVTTGPTWSYDRTLLPSAVVSNGQYPEIDPPARCLELECAIVPGRFGVAESGSLWIDFDAVPQRALIFAPQHLIVVIEIETVLRSLDDLFRQSGIAERVNGSLVSGPSKTADIEQHLVIGAQGPRSLTVIAIPT